MSRKILFRWLIIIASLMVVTFISCAVLTSRALADCGTPPRSSCISCHAPDGHVEVMGEWNSIHLSQDMCTNCHGGNGSTMDTDSAHVDIVAQPLSDIYTDCHSCHPEDYAARSAQFAATLGVTPSSCETPTPNAVYGESSEPPSGGIVASSGHINATLRWENLSSIAGILVILAFFLLGLGWLERHRIIG
jgi:hypothetical protein